MKNQTQKRRILNRYEEILNQFLINYKKHLKDKQHPVVINNFGFLVRYINLDKKGNPSFNLKKERLDGTHFGSQIQKLPKKILAEQEYILKKLSYMQPFN